LSAPPQDLSRVQVFARREIDQALSRLFAQMLEAVRKSQDSEKETPVAWETQQWLGSTAAWAGAGAKS